MEHPVDSLTCSGPVMQRLELAPHEALPLEPQAVPPLVRGGGGHLGEVVGHHAGAGVVKALLSQHCHCHSLCHSVPIRRREDGGEKLILK